MIACSEEEFLKKVRDNSFFKKFPALGVPEWVKKMDSKENK